MADHVGPPLPCPIGTPAARHWTFFLGLRCANGTTTIMDELDASMNYENANSAGQALTLAIASAPPDQLELSPTRVARDPDGAPSGGKPRKKKKAVHSTDESSGMEEDDDSAIAAPSLQGLQDLAAHDAGVPSTGPLQHSTARRHASALHGLMTDVSVAAFPEENAYVTHATDAIAEAAQGEVAVRSSPPKSGIRMAPQGKAVTSAAGWKTWERRQSPTASSSAATSGPPSPSKGGGEEEAAARNRFAPIREEDTDGQVRHAPHIVGFRWSALWIAVVVMNAMTATDYPRHVCQPRGHDTSDLIMRQVTPFSSQELKGAWSKIREHEDNEGLDTPALIAKAMQNMAFRDRVLATEPATVREAANEQLALIVREANGVTAQTRQSTIQDWVTRREGAATVNPRRPGTAPIQLIDTAEGRAAEAATPTPPQARYTIPKSSKSQAGPAFGTQGNQTLEDLRAGGAQAKSPIGPQGLRPQSGAGIGGAAGSSVSHSRAECPDDATDTQEAARDGEDEPTVETLEEKVFLIAGNPQNQLIISDESIALQFGEHMYDQAVPNFDEILGALCLSRGGKGPWLLSVSRLAAQVALQGDRKWSAFSKEGSEAELTLWEADREGNKIAPVNAEREARVRESATRRQREEEIKVLIIVNAPKRFLGAQLKKRQMEPIVTAIKDVVKDVEGIQYGISQGLTPELRKPRNSLNLFLNPSTSRTDPYDTMRAALPKLKYLPIREDSYHVEPASAFIPPDTLKKIGITSCCFRSEEVCKAHQQFGGFCTFRTVQHQTMGYNASIFRGGGGGSRENAGAEKKRKREAQEQEAAVAAERAKAMRVQRLLDKLCKLYKEGKVSRAHTPPTHAEHAWSHACYTHAVREGSRLPQPAQRHHCAQAHTMHVRKGSARGWGHVPLHSGHVPLCQPRRGKGGGDHPPRRDGHGTLRRRCAATGLHRDRAHGPTYGQREPEHGDQRSRDGQLPQDTGRLPTEASQASSVRTVRRPSRLAHSVQASGGRSWLRTGSGMQQQRMLVPTPAVSPRPHATTVYRQRVERRAHTHAHASERRGRPVAHDVPPGGRTSGSVRARTSRGILNDTLTDTHHWHTQNILWLEGRLPWHRVKRNA